MFVLKLASLGLRISGELLCFTVCIVQLHQSLNKFEWQRLYTHDDK